MAKYVRKIHKAQARQPKGAVAVQIRIDGEVKKFDSSEDGILALAVRDGKIYTSIHINGEDLLECFVYLFINEPDVGRMAIMALQELQKKDIAVPPILGMNGKRIN